MARKIFITVAERSADQHAANLVRAIRELDPSLEFHALGGDALREAGATVHHDTVSNAAMGLAAFKRAAEVKRLLNWTRQFYADHHPDLHICCDSWTMNSHFAKLAKSMGAKVFYYIGPQVWASREGRVKRLRVLADRVACILPFEESYLRERGVDATFVGHPLFDEMEKDKPAKTAEQTGEATAKAAFPVIGLPCGSRRGVVRANLPRQLEVARQIKVRFPQATFLIPTTPVTHPIVQSMIAGLDYVQAEVNGFDRQLPRCDLAISVSGTATLQIAAHRVPMIVVYYANAILWQLIGRWIVRIRTYSVVNLLAAGGKDDRSRHIVPEVIPWNGPVDGVSTLAIELLSDPQRRAQQRAQLDAMLASIEKPGASTNAAKIAISLLP